MDLIGSLEESWNLENVEMIILRMPPYSWKEYSNLDFSQLLGVPSALTFRLKNKKSIVGSFFKEAPKQNHPDETVKYYEYRIKSE